MKYYNLTQAEGNRMCYFRSTDIEQKNYKRLLWSVPDEMLYFLAQGKKIIIVDKSLKPKGKVEKIFIPVLNDLLNYLYFKQKPANPHLQHHWWRAWTEIKRDVQLRRKFLFWKKYLRFPVEIRAETVKVERERTRLGVL